LVSTIKCLLLARVCGVCVCVWHACVRAPRGRFEEVRDAKERAASAAAAVVSAETGGSAAVHILLVEDNAINQKLLTRFCTRGGHNYTLAADGVGAVEAFCRRHFDLVFMDVQMPRMDGNVATMHIRKLEDARGVAPERRVPIIGLSANALEEDEDLSLTAGMTSYVVFYSRGIPPTPSIHTCFTKYILSHTQHSSLIHIGHNSGADGGSSL
jgi:CheY-like chemotaxis protein